MAGMERELMVKKLLKKYSMADQLIIALKFKKKLLINSNFSSYELFSGSKSKKIVTYSKNKEEFQEHFKNMIIILKK